MKNNNRRTCIDFSLCGCRISGIDCVYRNQTGDEIEMEKVQIDTIVLFLVHFLGRHFCKCMTYTRDGAAPINKFLVDRETRANARHLVPILVIRPKFDGIPGDERHHISDNILSIRRWIPRMRQRRYTEDDNNPTQPNFVYLTNSRLVLEIDESSSFELSCDTWRSVHVFVYKKVFLWPISYRIEECNDMNNVNVAEVTFYQNIRQRRKRASVQFAAQLNSRHLLVGTWNIEEILEMLKSIALGHPIRHSQGIWLLSFSLQAANVMLSKPRHAEINKNQKHMFYCAAK